MIVGSAAFALGFAGVVVLVIGVALLLVVDFPARIGARLRRRAGRAQGAPPEDPDG